MNQTEEEGHFIANNNNYSSNMSSTALDVASNSTTATTTDNAFHWTAVAIVWAVSVFVLAGLAEIVGGWLVWAAIRGNAASVGKKQKKPWWFALLGSAVLVTYGFIPCLQPTNSFGRIYAVYGGFFIVMSFLLGWALDGDKPDVGDLIGGIIALVGVCVIMFWPR